MAYRRASRDGSVGPDSPPPVATLADVLNVVLHSAEIADRQRQGMASALRTIAKVSNHSLSTIPCEVKAVRRVLESIAPARHGLSQGRWKNVKSLTLRSLDLANVPRLPSRSSAPLSTEWEALISPLPYRPFGVALRPFARFCSRLGVGPYSADESTFRRYERELDEFSGKSRPREAFLDAVRAWNRAGEISPAWPVFRAPVEHRRKNYALAWTAFPAALKADVDAMVRASVSPDPLNPTSRKPIKPISAESRVGMLRALASALVHQGCDRAKLDNIRALVDIDRAKLALQFIYERRGKMKSAHIHQAAKLLCTLAQHWVGVPRDHLEQLKAIRKQLDPGGHGMTDKNRSTLRVFQDDRLVDRFLSLPERIWQRYRGKLRGLKVSDAVELQIALVIELLTVAPIRCKNLMAIRLGDNLIFQGSGRARRVTLHFPQTDVKNDVVIEFELPTTTVDLLDSYLKHVRPRLERVPSRYLFPGEGETHKGGSLLSKQIADMVEREVGGRLTAHQFRHLAGFIYLKANPGGHEVVRRLLGHKSIETTIRFYAGMEVAGAIRHYDDHVAERRARLVRRDRPRARKSNG